MADLRDEALDLAAYAVQCALAAGASDAEATVGISDRFSCEARESQLTKLEQSRGRSLAMRAFAGTRKATLATTDLTRDGIRALAARLVDAVGYVTDDPHAGLPASATPVADDPALGLVCDDVAARAPQAKIDDALALERAIRAADPRATNSRGSHASDAQTTVALVNSRGFRGAYRATQASLSTAPVVIDGDEKRIAHYGTAARGYAGLEPLANVAHEAVRRAVALVGARKPQTMTVPVIFERDVAATVLSDLFAALSAANIAVGNSYLTGAIGTTIGSSLVTIVDDGRLAGGLGTSPFDAEGTPTRRTVVFERGTLRTFLADTYYGRRLGMASTANASGGGIGPNNFYLEAGSGTLDELIARTERGVLVLDTIGFATEYATGTYSRGARGLWIEDGKLAYPVDEFTIAANFRDMLAGIDAVAGDLRFDGPVVAPSFRVAGMTVSGT